MTNILLNSSKTVSSHLPKRPVQKKQNRLGPYVLLQTLGEGEFGKVKLGVHSETGQEVAIKLIKKVTQGPENHVQKVEREISVLKTLQHPYIVKLFSVVETEKYIGLILEYASGGELFEHILAHKFLKEEDAKRFFAQLMSSVKYMHDRDIVHRDLKLENLLLDRNRNIIVTDFGFANQFQHDTDDLMATTCGSPCYAAPELVVNKGAYAGSAADIWSCGVILYAMLCGFLPFDDDPSNPESDNINQLYRYILSTHVAFPSHVSPGARDLLEKILVTDPAKRCSLNDIIHHPWLNEYKDFLKLDMNQIEHHLNGKGKPVLKTPQNLVVNTSMSAAMPTRQNRRSPRLSVVDHDRFAPVANEKYKRGTMPKEASKLMQFATRKITADTPHVSKTLKFNTIVPRKPVPAAFNDMTVSPEISHSSPFGSIRRGQQRADKFLSFFTAKLAQQKEVTGSTEDPDSKEKISSESDVSTLSVSEHSLAPEEPPEALVAELETIEETGSEQGSVRSTHRVKIVEMPSPEISPSTRLGESGRKAMAAVRRSINRRGGRPPIEISQKSSDAKKSGMIGWIKKRSAKPDHKPELKPESILKPVSEPVSEPVQQQPQSKRVSEQVARYSQVSTVGRRSRALSGNDAFLKQLDTHILDSQIPIHQGAIDRNALTSQHPTAIIKDVLRILRILGIETEVEDEFVVNCHRPKSKTKQTGDDGHALMPIYGDATVDNGDEIRFSVEICRFENLPGLYIVNVRRLKGNTWAYKFLYHKLIDFLYFDKNGYL